MEPLWSSKVLSGVFFRVSDAIYLSNNSNLRISLGKKTLSKILRDSCQIHFFYCVFPSKRISKTTRRSTQGCLAGVSPGRLTNLRHWRCFAILEQLQAFCESQPSLRHFTQRFINDKSTPAFWHMPWKMPPSIFSKLLKKKKQWRTPKCKTMML